MQLKVFKLKNGKLEYRGIREAREGDALRAAFKRLQPDATEREFDILVSGEAPQDNKPEWSL